MSYKVADTSKLARTKLTGINNLVLHNLLRVIKQIGKGAFVKLGVTLRDSSLVLVI
jgi:hypothetical protein